MTVTVTEHGVRRPQALMTSACDACLLSRNPSSGRRATLPPSPQPLTAQVLRTRYGELRAGAQAHRVMKQNPWCCLSSDWLTLENSTKQSLLSSCRKAVSLELVSGSRRLIKTASRHSSPVGSSSPHHLLKRGCLSLPPTHCWAQCGRATLCDLEIH